MYKNKKIIFAIIIVFLIILITIGSHFNSNKNIDKNKDVQIEKNIVVPDIENVIEDESQNIADENIENANINENSIENIKEEVTQTEKITQVEVKESSPETQNVLSSYDDSSFQDGYLKNYPNFGNKYASLIIKKIDINAPVYFGTTDEILLQGVAHDSGSYFPGEGGTIIMCEHNYMNNFKQLGELRNGDIIEVKTSYGDFYYELYKFQTVAETELEKLPIQKDEEILMIYTCYPFNSKGHTEYRYVIYAKKI